MGLYVEVKLHTGQVVATMEIYREEPLSAREDSQGVYTYRWSRGSRERGRLWGTGVEHRRTDDAWDLVRACLSAPRSPLSRLGTRRRLQACVEAWPDCEEGLYHPSCCRFPKSCSCTVYDEKSVTEADLEPHAR